MVHYLGGMKPAKPSFRYDMSPANHQETSMEMLVRLGDTMLQDFMDTHGHVSRIPAPRAIMSAGSTEDIWIIDTGVDVAVNSISRHGLYCSTQAKDRYIRYCIDQLADRNKARHRELFLAILIPVLITLVIVVLLLTTCS